jgi:hypothetical protein
MTTPLILEPGGPDAFAPGSSPYAPALPAVQSFLSPQYTGAGTTGTQLYYSSAAIASSVVADGGTSLTISSISGLPQRYPFKLLLEWGTANQEIVICTGSPTGNGPYTYAGVLRGLDGGGPQIAHAFGAQVTHGVSAQDFYQARPCYNVCSTAFAGGADITGTLDSTQAFQAAINAAYAAGGGIIELPPGNFVISSTLYVWQTISIEGSGSNFSIVNFFGSGTCIACNVNGVFTGAGLRAGSYSGFSVNGYAGGPNAIGMSVGNLQDIRARDIIISGFSGGGLYFHNAPLAYLGTYAGWCEQASWKEILLVQNGGSSGYNVCFDNSSFDYSVFEFVIVANAGTDGVRLQNNAQLVGERFELKGNFNAGPGNTGAVLAFDRGNTAGTSVIKNAQLDVCVECDGATGLGHYSMYFGSTSNGQPISGTGVLCFNGGTVAFQAFNPNGIDISFAGQINDPYFGYMQQNDGLAIIGSTDLTAGESLTTNPYLGGLYLASGDVYAIQLVNGSTTLSVQSGYGSWCKKTSLLIAQPASGAPGYVTWPAGWVWEGGVAPTLSTKSSAVDRIEIVYLANASTAFCKFISGTAMADAEQFQVIAAAGYTLANVLTAVPLLNSTANGALTAQTATTYFFESEFDISGLSGSSHTLSLTFGGTATYTSVKYNADVQSPFVVGTAATWPTTVFTAATIQTLVAAGTNTTVGVKLKGVLRVNAGGTVIPQLTQGTASAAAVVSANSYFRFWAAGANTTNSVGNWS